MKCMPSYWLSFTLVFICNLYSVQFLKYFAYFFFYTKIIYTYLCIYNFIKQSIYFLQGPKTVLLYYTSFSSVLFTSFCHKNRSVKLTVCYSDLCKDILCPTDKLWIINNCGEKCFHLNNALVWCSVCMFPAQVSWDLYQLKTSLRLRKSDLSTPLFTHLIDLISSCHRGPFSKCSETFLT